MSRDPLIATTPMFMILPTDDIVRQPTPTNRVLARANLSTKQVVEDVLVQWAQNETDGYRSLWMYGDDPVEQIASNIISAYMNEATTPYLMPVFGDPAPEYDAAATLIHAICQQVFLYLLPLITKLNPCEYQLQTFRIHRWLTDSLVIEIHH
jgi:hypothetical protein